MGLISEGLGIALVPDLILRTVQHEDVVALSINPPSLRRIEGRDDAGPLAGAGREGTLVTCCAGAAAGKARAFAGAGDDGGTLTHPLVTTLTQRMVYRLARIGVDHGDVTAEVGAVDGIPEAG